MRGTVKDRLETIEEYELPEAASEEDLAVAETVLANLLVRQWLSSQQPKDSWNHANSRVEEGADS